MSPLGKEISIIYNDTAYIQKEKIQEIELYKKCNGSYIEYYIYKYLSKNSIKFIHHDREQIKPYELDFYLPDNHIGIECNGYWHTNNCISNRNQSEYHNIKIKLCTNKNITLYMIDDINDIDKQLTDIFSCGRASNTI